MAQNPLAATIAKNTSNSQTPVKADANNILVTGRGTTTALNQTAAGVIKAAPGRVSHVIILAPGSTSGAFTLNDCTTTGAAAAANTVWSMTYNSTLNVAGAVINVDAPFANGITLSAVPGGGSPIIAVVYA